MKLQSSKDDTAGISNPTTLQSHYFPAVKNNNKVTIGLLSHRLHKGYKITIIKVGQNGCIENEC
jgi:hypothetical protein